MQVQKADPVLRRRAALALASAAVVLLTVLIMVQHWLRMLSASLDPVSFVEAIKRVLGVCAVLTAVAVVALGWHLIARGRRVLADRRYPARDARVVRNTRIHEGATAVRIGKLCLATGFALCVFGVLVPALALVWLLRI